MFYYKVPYYLKGRVFMRLIQSHASGRRVATGNNLPDVELLPTCTDARALMGIFPFLLSFQVSILYVHITFLWILLVNCRRAIETMGLPYSLNFYIQVWSRTVRPTGYREDSAVNVKSRCFYIAKQDIRAGCFRRTA